MSVAKQIIQPGKTGFQSDESGFMVMGNDALARAILESGTRVITSYPGSPTPEIGAALERIPRGERQFHFEFSANEKVALEIAAGASLNGHLSCVFFKSVGLNVAADSLIQQALMAHVGGLVIILGDDPGANSSQNEQDNRPFARMSYIPMLEPADPQQAYDLYLEAASLSQERRMPVFLRLTTNVCHARQAVAFRSQPAQPYPWKSRYHNGNGPYFPVTRSLFPLKQRALNNIEQLKVEANRFVQRVQIRAAQHRRNGQPVRGIIAAGLPALETLEVCEQQRASVTLLTLQMTYPLPEQEIRRFLAEHDEVFIIEELDRVLETEIKALAYDAGLTVRIHARPPDEIMGELDRQRIARVLAQKWPDLSTPPTPVNTVQSFVSPERLPQLCPGCGHRSAFFAARGVLDDNSIVVGDIGCLTLGALPPHEMGEILFSMGHSVSTAAGLAIRNPGRKVMALMGDGTFFHAGIPGVINAAANQSNITLYLLDNATTAMTGHQPRPGNGQIGDKINIPELLASLGVQFIRQADAYNLELLRQHLTEAFAYKGFAVVIAKHPCMLQLTRANRKKNPLFRLAPVQITRDLTNDEASTIAAFGCPSFERNEDGAIEVNEDLCIGCGACVSACPSGVLQRGGVQMHGKDKRK